MISADDRVRDWPKEQGFENVEIGGADGTRLRLVMGGPKWGRPVVLVHGAPQLSYAWRRVMPLLTDRYRIIAPDLRGYGASALPRSGRYDMDILVEDLRIVVDWALARYDEGLAAKDGEAMPADRRALLVGHDWGGPIGWALAERHPDRLRHLVAVNGPHMGAFARDLIHPGQMLRSWYVGLFKLPLIDLWIERSEASLFLWMMRSSARRGTFSEEDLGLYRAAFSRPGRATAVLAYYRQTFRRDMIERRRRLLRSPRVRVPATIVWGDRDAALHRRQAEGTARFADAVEVRHLPGVSHWVPEERPEAIAQAVIDADRDHDDEGGRGARPMSE